jgi:anti-anti-sigma factor
MAFSVNLEMTPNGIAKVTLAGELDASVADQFKTKIEAAATQKAKRVALIMKDLSYMASAGLRVLIFAKQKMGPKVDIYVVGAQATVKDTLEKTGLHHSLIALDTYDAKQIESV